MRAIKKFVCVIGVILSIAPIFSSVWAQQSNQQANLFMEIQALRSEIAELRDMVERQQYQLRQLQKATRATNSIPLPPSVNSAPGGQYSDPSAIESDIDSGQDSSSNPAVLDPDEYQADSQVRNAERRASGDVVIEERVIDPDLHDPGSLPRPFPPVEERNVVDSNSSTSSARPDQAESSQTESIQIEPIQAESGRIIVPTDKTVRDAANYPSDEDAAIKPVYQLPAQTTQPQTEPLLTGDDSASVDAAESEQSYYQRGFDLLRQSKHSEAITFFKQQIASYPQGDLADDAHYWIAESMYVNRSLDISKQYFRAIIDNFAQSPRLPDAMLKTAYIEQEQGNNIEARILLQEIIQFHPRSNAAISAKNRLAKLN